jgi:hypothetical protein
MEIGLGNVTILIKLMFSKGLKFFDTIDVIPSFG